MCIVCWPRRDDDESEDKNRSSKEYESGLQGLQGETYREREDGSDNEGIVGRLLGDTLSFKVLRSGQDWVGREEMITDGLAMFL